MLNPKSQDKSISVGTYKSAKRLLQKKKDLKIKTFSPLWFDNNSVAKLIADYWFAALFQITAQLTLKETRCERI